MTRLASLLLMLTACAPAGPDWTRPGADAATVDRALRACSRQAARQVPLRPGIATAPAATLGGACSGFGCPGPAPTPDLFDIDRNAPLRTQARATCMADLGFSRVRPGLFFADPRDPGAAP